MNLEIDSTRSELTALTTSRRAFLGTGIAAAVCASLSGCTMPREHGIETGASMLDALGGYVDFAHLPQSYVKKYMQPLTAQNLIGDAKYVIFADNHEEPALRAALTRQLPAMKEAGITHFSFEFLPRGVNANGLTYGEILTEVESFNYNKKTWTREALASFASLMHEAAKLGFSVDGIFPRDTAVGFQELKDDPRLQSEDSSKIARSDHWSDLYYVESILQIARKNPQARFAVLAGAAHTNFLHENEYYNYAMHGLLIRDGTPPEKVKNLVVSTPEAFAFVGKRTHPESPHPYPYVKTDGYLPLPNWAPADHYGNLRSSLDGIVFSS